MKRKTSILSTKKTECFFYDGYRVGVSEFSDDTIAITKSTPASTSPPGVGRRGPDIPPSLMLPSIVGIVGLVVALGFVSESRGDQ